MKSITKIIKPDIFRLIIRDSDHDFKDIEGFIEVNADESKVNSAFEHFLRKRVIADDGSDWCSVFKEIAKKLGGIYIEIEEIVKEV